MSAVRRAVRAWLNRTFPSVPRSASATSLAAALRAARHAHVPRHAPVLRQRERAVLEAGGVRGPPDQNEPLAAAVAAARGSLRGRARGPPS